MSLKVKIILAAIAFVVIVASVISIYVYISKLNDTVNEMSVTITNQANDIGLLKSNIESLNKEIESLDSVISVTNDYISSIKQINDDDMSIKQAIYEQVISNEEVKDWFSENLPDDILAIINSDADIGVCEDSN
jgi:peptidoglycan hydrolase CwlO-like protein